MINYSNSVHRMIVTPFALQLAQLTSRMHLQRPTNHVLSTFDPSGPTYCGTVPSYVEMPKSPTLRPDTSLGTQFSEHPLACNEAIAVVRQFFVVE